MEEIRKEKEVDSKQPDAEEESVAHDPNSANPTEMQNSGGKDGVEGLSGDPPEQQDLQNAVEDSEDNKANSEAMGETTVIDEEEEKKVAADNETVTPKDAEVAEIDEHSKSTKEQGTLVTFGISAMEAVREIRFRIEQKTQLTASAGKYS